MYTQPQKLDALADASEKVMDDEAKDTDEKRERSHAHTQRLCSGTSHVSHMYC
jgi:hypothetical protein